MLDSKAVHVELVGRSGATPLKTTVKGFHGIQGGSVITVKGKVMKKGKNVRVLASEIQVG
jgi:hypothetical protein